MMKKPWILTLIVLLLFAVLSYLLYVVLQPPKLTAGFLYGNGHIEGTEIRISSEISGRVIESRLQEGKQVKEGGLLIRIDDSDFQTQLKKGVDEEESIKSALVRIQEQLDTWRHHLKTANADLHRNRELKKSAAISPQQLNKIEDRQREAEGQVKSLEAELMQTRAQLDAAQQQVKWLRLQVDKTRITSPISATILTKAIEEGEFATPGRTVAVLVDLNRLELKIYIPERDIGRIKLGSSARVRVDAFPEHYFDATVTRVDQQAQFTPRDIHMPEERVRMVFGVTLLLNNKTGHLKPGMPADAWLRTENVIPWPDKLVVPR